MKMLFQVQVPPPVARMSGCGIQVNFWPEWKKAVVRWNKTQSDIDKAVSNLHRFWLDGCGFDDMFDPDKDPMAEWESKHLNKKKKLGPNARPVYGESSIRVSWGEWGPEHITVPGNACGLDISHSIGGVANGMSLLPHNVDRRDQAYLLLVVFTWFADCVILNEQILNQE